MRTPKDILDFDSNSFGSNHDSDFATFNENNSHTNFKSNFSSNEINRNNRTTLISNTSNDRTTNLEGSQIPKMLPTTTLFISESNFDRTITNDSNIPKKSSLILGNLFSSIKNSDFQTSSQNIMPQSKSKIELPPITSLLSSNDSCSPSSENEMIDESGKTKMYTQFAGSKRLLRKSSPVHNKRKELPENESKTINENTSESIDHGGIRDNDTTISMIPKKFNNQQFVNNDLSNTTADQLRTSNSELTSVKTKNSTIENRFSEYFEHVVQTFHSRFTTEFNAVMRPHNIPIIIPNFPDFISSISNEVNIILNLSNKINFKDFEPIRSSINECFTESQTYLNQSFKDQKEKALFNEKKREKNLQQISLEIFQIMSNLKNSNLDLSRELEIMQQEAERKNERSKDIQQQIDERLKNYQFHSSTLQQRNNQLQTLISTTENNISLFQENQINMISNELENQKRNREDLSTLVNESLKIFENEIHSQKWTNIDTNIRAIKSESKSLKEMLITDVNHFSHVIQATKEIQQTTAPLNHKNQFNNRLSSERNNVTIHEAKCELDESRRKRNEIEQYLHQRKKKGCEQ